MRKLVLTFYFQALHTTRHISRPLSTHVNNFVWCILIFHFFNRETEFWTENKQAPSVIIVWKESGGLLFGLHSELQVLGQTDNITRDITVEFWSLTNGQPVIHKMRLKLQCEPFCPAAIPLWGIIVVRSTVYVYLTTTTNFNNQQTGLPTVEIVNS